MGPAMSRTIAHNPLNAYMYFKQWSDRLLHRPVNSSVLRGCHSVFALLTLSPAFFYNHQHFCHLEAKDRIKKHIFCHPEDISPFLLGIRWSGADTEEESRDSAQSLGLNPSISFVGLYYRSINTTIILYRIETSAPQCDVTMPPLAVASYSI